MNLFKKYGTLFLLLYPFVAVFSQNLPPFTSMDSDTLTWKDTNGIHLLLLEQSDAVTDEDTGTLSQGIRAVHWLKKDNLLQKTWSFDDGIEDCAVDIEAKFLATPRFSDLDGDGIFEIWFITQKSCKGDISPSVIQVIMVDHENTKYVMDAVQKLIFADGTTDGGTYELGNFKSLPKSYQNYALHYLFDHYAYKY